MSVDHIQSSYSRTEITDALRDWMLKTYGRPADMEDPDQWMRDFGMIYSFLFDHFPGKESNDE